MNPTTCLSLSINFMSIIIMLTSTSWLTMWMTFELNMVSFIPLMMKEKNSSTPDGMIKYFIIQATGSIILITAMIMNKSMTTMQTTLITMAMITKLGCFPTHQWLPTVSESMSTNTLTLLLTTQKIMPFTLLTNFKDNNIIPMTAALTALTGAFGGYNQTMLRKLLAYSSITHMGWMLPLTNNKTLLMLYITIYSTIVASITLPMKNQLTNLQSLMMKDHMNTMTMNMLSLGGMPPLMGFAPKMLTIKYTIEMKNLMMLSFLIISAIINLSFYLSMTMKSTMMTTSKTTSNMWNTKTSTTLSSLSISTLIPLLMFT